MAALIAATGMSAGDQALVTALNKVFMYTGSAWYLVATMTNDSPTAITGVDGTYSLANDGTATTITAVSTDPEGFPLTWSYAVTTGSLGSTATVSQADNVFTITPSTTEADAGTFSITFSVTDGTTGAVSAVSSFTLVFEPALSSANYNSKSFSFTSLQTKCTGMAFNPDGSKMYSVGWQSPRVHEFNLTTNFDISTASYNNIELIINPQSSRISAMTFNTDGTKMYIVSFHGTSAADIVFQYNLTTGFDLSTASYSNVSFSFAAENLYPQDIVFNPNGTKLYILDATNAGLYEYGLTTGFDLSTASYSNVSFSVSGQDSFPTGISFSTSGRTIFMCGSTSDTVYEYGLTTGFDLSTASYSNVSFSVSGQAADPQGVAFNSGFSKMYIPMIGGSIHQYSL
jgi:hypothetical protein